MGQLFLYIKRYLLVSCIASGIVVVMCLVRCITKDDYSFRVINNTYIDNVFSKFRGVVKGIDADVEGEEDELFKIGIPKINLLKKVYDINSKMNDVNLNIELLDSSNIEDNLYFLASHSGGGVASYFDDLIYLEVGDIIFIKGKVGNLVYVIDKIFCIEKKGYFEVSDIKDRLYLITCSLSKRDEQLVISAKRS